MSMRQYSTKRGKEKLYEDLKRKRSTTATPRSERSTAGSRRRSVDTSGTPVMAGKVDRTKKLTFSEAFKNARKRGQKTFTWKGDKFTTELASEKKKTKKKTTTRRPLLSRVERDAQKLREERNRERVRKRKLKPKQGETGGAYTRRSGKLLRKRGEGTPGGARPKGESKRPLPNETAGAYYRRIRKMLRGS